MPMTTDDPWAWTETFSRTDQPSKYSLPPEPPFGMCSGCPSPARCRVDGCHGMDGVELTAEDLDAIG